MTHIHVCDVETTGLDPEVDRIVEVAVLTVDVIRKVVCDTPVDVLVYPGIPIPPEASAIHHITDDMVAGMPAFAGVRPAFDLLEGDFAAHNASFDSAFVGPTKRPWICTMRVAKHLWPEAPGFGNQVLRYWLKLDVEAGATHRAESDAQVTAQLLIREIEELSPADDIVQTLLELTEKSVLLRTVPFGKHRGELWKDVPRDYLSWMARQQWDDPDVVYTLQEAINRRFAA